MFYFVGESSHDQRGKAMLNKFFDEKERKRESLEISVKVISTDWILTKNSKKKNPENYP